MRYKRELKKIKSGMSLVELVLAMAILSFVLLAIYSFLLSGNRTFIGGTNQYDAQSEIRTIADYVVKTTRLSTALTLEPILESPRDTDYDYIYVNSGKLYHYASNGSSHTLSAFGGNINASSFSGSIEDGKTILNFSLAKESGGREYSLSDTTELPNLTLKKEALAPSGSVIKFSKLSKFIYQGPAPSSTSGLPTSATSTTVAPTPAPTTATTASSTAPSGSETTATTALPTVEIKFSIVIGKNDKYRVELYSTSTGNTYNQKIETNSKNPAIAIFNDVPADSSYAYKIYKIPANKLERSGTIVVTNSDVLRVVS